MRYQVLTILCLGMIISLSAMNCEYVTRFAESNVSMRLNNMIIEDEKLFLCKEYGVDIFEIENSGELTLLNTIHADDVNNFTIYNNNLYFSCCTFGDNVWDTIVYKYDVSDPQQPVETGQLELDYPPYTMYILDEMLTIVNYISGQQLRYYDPETFEYLGQIPRTFLVPFYDNYWCTHHSESLEIYDLSNPFNAVEVTSVDLEPVNNGSPHVCRRVSDELYVVYSQLEMSLWDTSDFNNWQLLSQFPFPDFEILFYDLNIIIWDNKILLPLVEQTLVVDISDPYSPDISQTLYLSLFNPTNCLKYNDTIYLVDYYTGIQKLNIVDNIVELGEVQSEYPRIIKGLFYNDFIIRENWSKYSDLPDMNIWDVAIPEEPAFLDTITLGSDRFFYSLTDNKLVLKNTSNYQIEIFDTSALPELVLLGQVDYFNSEYEIMYGNLKVFEDAPNQIFLSKPDGSKSSWNISNPQNPELNYEFVESNFYISSKNGDYLYLIENYTSVAKDLKVYSGINVNNPQLTAYYPNVLPSDCNIKILDEKLFCSSSDDPYTTQVFGLIEADSPDFLCNLYTDFSGRVYTYDNEYIVCSEHEASSFTIPDNPPQYIEPSCLIGRFNFINDIEFQSYQNNDYLIVVDQCYTEVYQIGSTENDQNLITETIKMITYPNPFSFDNGDVITFYSQKALFRYCEDALLSIYNIKGQLIHQQEVDLGRDSELHWDCRINNGNKAPSGVYLYKVDAGEDSSVGKFIITK
jgi:hypothetical protein